MNNGCLVPGFLGIEDLRGDKTLDGSSLEENTLEKTTVVQRVTVASMITGVLCQVMGPKNRTGFPQSERTETTHINRNTEIEISGKE